MNLQSGNLENEIESVKFNEDEARFVCGSKTGYSVHRTIPQLSEECQMFVEGGISLAELFDDSQYVAVVGLGTNAKFPSNNVVVWDIKLDEVYCSIRLGSEVKGTKFNMKLIAVVLESSIKVYTFSQNPIILREFQTAYNSKGLCMTIPNDSSTIIFPSLFTGYVRVFDVINIPKNNKEIRAHNNLLACIAVNSEGTMIATASERGTLIRLFSLSTGKKINELRRGSFRADIHCINFSKNSDKLCISSDHGTIHIFYIKAEDSVISVGILGYMPSLVSSIISVVSSSLLPTYINSTWSSYKIQVPDRVQCICAFSESNSIILVCKNGKYYKYFHTPEGEAKLEYSSNFVM